MTNPQKVHEFLKANPRKFFCDGCLGKKTGVNRHEVNMITSTLVLFPDEFGHLPTLCSGKCSIRNKMAIQAF